MAGYTIYYTDPAKNSNPILVADGTKNSQSTSLTLIGRNYPGYGQAIAEDLVHLLENFASSTPPNNPIEGQLWFDTSDPNNKKLRINDGGATGAKWAPINGLFQQPDQPIDVKLGDIWVDTANQQLKFYNGLNFTLVGPSYSSTTRTGSYPEQWMDTAGVLHDLIINYVNDTPIEIIAREQFTPNPVIEGFTLLNPGMNISSNFQKIYGIADSASSLQISIPSSQKINADNFMRKDVPQSSKGALQILVDGNSLQLGSDPTFILERRSGYNAVFSNQDGQGQFTFEVQNTPIVVMDGPNRHVTFSNSSTAASQYGIEVFGSVKASNSATFDTLYIMSPKGNVDDVPGNAVEVLGGAGIGGTLVVYGQHILKGPLTVGETQPSPISYSPSSMIVPTKSVFYDLGDPQARWRNVYGSVFLSGNGSTAQFVGIASSATSLASPSAFQVAGDMTSTPVSFAGNGQGVTITVSPTPNLINNRTAASVSTSGDSILFATQTNIFRQTKRDFFRDVNYQEPSNPALNPGYTTPSGSLVPIGTILPYAGDTAVLPPGWVLCNGSALPSDPKYQNLKNIIQNRYGSPFLTPNLVGNLSAGGVAINYIMKY